MGLCQTPETFDSNLAQHIYDSPHQSLLLDNTFIIAADKGLVQVFRGTVEIKKHIPQKVTLNRDTEETFLSPIYNKLINSSYFYIHPQNFTTT
jgi:hypothetical protein